METLKHQTETKAVKEHNCSYCGQKIRVGETYLKSTHKYDGEVYDWKCHKYCDDLAHHLNMFDDADEGVTHDIFCESVSEVYSDLMIGLLREANNSIYSDIIQQLRLVPFRDKLWYVTRSIAKKAIVKPTQEELDNQPF